MRALRAFADIPLITLPGNYLTHLGPFLASMYELTVRELGRWSWSL